MEAVLVSSGTRLLLGREEGVPIGRKDVGDDPRCSRKQVLLRRHCSTQSDYVQVEVVGKNNSFVEDNEGGVRMLRPGERATVESGVTVWLLRSTETNTLMHAVRIEASPSSSGVAERAEEAAGTEAARKRKREGCIAQDGEPNGGAAVDAPSARPSKEVICIDDDDDGGGEGVEEVRAPPARQAVPHTRPQGQDAAVAELSVGLSGGGGGGGGDSNGRRSREPGEWRVRRRGQFEAYAPEAQTLLEAAYQSGQPSVCIVVAGESFRVAFDTMRQEQPADARLWRPVRRQPLERSQSEPTPAAGEGHAQAITNGGAAAASAASSSTTAAAAAADGHAAQLAEVRRQRAKAFESAVHSEQATAMFDAAALRKSGPLHVLTYNLWFAPHLPALRMREVARLASGPLADGARPAALAMQEVTPSLLSALTPALRAAGYSAPWVQPWDRCPSNGAETYGVAIALRPPLTLLSARYVPFQRSMMGRGVVVATAAWTGAPQATAVGAAAVGTAAGDAAGAVRLVLGSTHLESWVGEEHQGVVVPNRRAQLTEACRLMASELRATPGGVGAMLMGDMNWQDKKDGDAMRYLGAGWVDAWQVAGKPKGATNTCWGSRFDRCFYLDRSAVDAGAASSGDGGGGRTLSGAPVTAPHHTPPSLQPRAVRLVGTEQGPHLEGKHFVHERRDGTRMEKPLYPSDHRGVLISFETA